MTADTVQVADVHCDISRFKNNFILNALWMLF
jgi:hypothetical protein